MNDKITSCMDYGDRAQPFPDEYPSKPQSTQDNVFPNTQIPLDESLMGEDIVPNEVDQQTTGAKLFVLKYTRAQKTMLAKDYRAKHNQNFSSQSYNIPHDIFYQSYGKK